MSMVQMTIRQILQIFAVYSLMTVLLPAWIFGRKLRRFRLEERFLMYQVIGAFFMANLVFLLQLLHICNPVTLWVFTVLIVFVAYTKVNHLETAEEFYRLLDSFTRFLGGITGKNTMRTMARHTFHEKLEELLAWVKEHILKHLAEWLLLVVFMGYLVYIQGDTYLERFGYNTSDLVVHNYWVNSLSQGKLFVAGVYPYGYHCVLYYLHALFRIDAYVFLRVFGLVNVTFIGLNLYAFLRSVCKYRVTPFFALFVFTGLDIWRVEEYVLRRFQYALPQEFGMIFLLPTLYMAMLFFRRRSEEIRTKLEEEVRKGFAEGFDPEAQEDAWELENEGFEAGVASRRALRDAEESGESIYLEEGEEEKKSRLRDFWKKARRKHPVRSLLERLDRAQDSTTCLIVFAFGFSLTFAAHFYVVMISGLGCIAIAIAYFWRFLHKEYFRPVMLSGIIAVVLAVYPMVIAFIGGTPMEGSLRWGLSILNASSSQTEGSAAEDVGTEPAAEGEGDSAAAEYEAPLSLSELATADTGYPETAAEEGTQGGSAAEQATGSAAEQSAGFAAEQSAGPPAIAESGKAGIGGRLSGILAELQRRWKAAVVTLEKGLSRMVLARETFAGIDSRIVLYLVLAAGVLLGLLSRFRDGEYGRIVVAVSLLFGWMLFTFMMRSLGLPALMDEGRATVFLVYAASAAAALVLDAALYLGPGWIHGRFSEPLICAGAFAVIAYLTVTTGHLRTEPVLEAALELNGAIASLTSIIAETPDGSWTIVSANDETHMGSDHGYHYEVITFLREMEGYSPEQSAVYIPTEYVYLFIEKIPTDYRMYYWGSGQAVSEEGAAQMVPYGRGITMYYGESRWVCMSKMYYWAQEFRRLYPNEMKVFYEDEEFVCYVVHQNTYALYNFAIDYGFNNPLADEGEGEAL